MYFAVNMLKQLSLIFFFLLVFSPFAKAQEEWPSPEVAQIYKQAREYLMAGSFKQAITTYRQAIQLAPEKMVLYRDLGKAYYLSQDYENAKKILEPVVKSNDADDQSILLLANCYATTGDKKKARSEFEKGIERFPNSGLLYHDLGKLYEEDNDLPKALNAWLTGIKNNPAYHVNYYEAARIYATTKKPIWAILYGEIFVLMERHTQRADDTRKMLIAAYTSMYANPTTEVPTFGQVKKEKEASSFEEAVTGIYAKLSAVVSDGITTESLIMLRTRFLMDYYTQYAAKYPFSLFSYQDDLVRNGYFDIYNEWLFGKIENAQFYEAWNKFHPGDMNRFENWLSLHSLHPKTSDDYNTSDMKEVFGKKKK